MTTSNSSRAAAIYQAVSAQSGFSLLTSAERAQVEQSLLAIFGADLAYLVGNVTVVPTALKDPGGAKVQVSPTSGTGSVTAPIGITGTGTIS